MKKLYCCLALEFFCCLPLWKTVLFSSSRVFQLSTPTFQLSTPIENSEASWKKASNGLTTQIEFIFCVYYLSQCEFLPKTENCNSCGLSISISGTIRGVVFWTLRHFKGKFCLLKNSSTVQQFISNISNFTALSSHAK